MTLEIAILFALILGLIVVLALELIPPDTASLVLMVLLMVGGFVSPQEGLSGMSNQATVTVLALMILSVGLETTGVITSLGRRLRKLFDQQEWVIILTLMIIVGGFSAFISTTAVVIVFLRIIINLSKEIQTNLSKLLMPLSFAAILGGSCTLFGTSTNLLVSSIARENGIEAFGIFEFSKIGVIFWIGGILFMLFAGRHIIPARKKKEDSLINEYEIQDYLTEISIQPGSTLAGKKIGETSFFTDDEIDLIELKTREEKPHFPTETEILREGDVLLIKAGLETIAELRLDNEVKLLPRKKIEDDDRLNTEDMILCEVVVQPNSRLLGKSLKKIPVRRDYNAIPLALRKNRKTYSRNFNKVRVESGDTLLMEVGKSNFRRFYNLPGFVVLQEHENLAPRTDKRWLAAGIMIAVILVASFQLLPILVSALAGCAIMFLTGCLKMQQAYQRVDWSVYFLLAGVIPLGIAMNNTGASQLIADTFVALFGAVSPRSLISVLFIFTAILSAVISNNATAVLLAPIAISIAGNLQLDPRPLLFTVMFAANASFMSPIGYQTNTLIYGPGNYSFFDFVKVGGFLTLLVWLLATLIIPYWYF
ncbi:MAG: SLC13 family permease [Bacteroidetes bacterium]|nr:SLC13 family permease [Bacteroidota bacterium]